VDEEWLGLGWWRIYTPGVGGSDSAVADPMGRGSGGERWVDASLAVEGGGI
jgi:hypothetical protein